MFPMPHLACILLSLLARRCSGRANHEQIDIGWDQSNFITRPNMRSPSFNITLLEAESTASGYWFLAPYFDPFLVDQHPQSRPFQVGPYIFNQQGELIWSGTELCENRNVYDFRLQDVNGNPALTFILAETEVTDTADPAAHGVILDTSYQQIKNISLEKQYGYLWDLHEFRIYHGTTSISSMRTAAVADVSSLGLPPQSGSQISVVWDTGSKETDINTGQVLREWFPQDAGVTVAESYISPPQDWFTSDPIMHELWDYFTVLLIRVEIHLNSVDKNTQGDYLVSSRYTNTIYKVSGSNGSVIWRLGGKQSDFVQDFTFSSQHFASFHTNNDSVTVISFLDNACDEAQRQPSTANTSSIKVVALYTHTRPKTARLLQQFDRPDGGLTKMRGSAQRLPDGGFFAGWGENGHITEFAADGRSVLEAKFTHDRCSNYRAYKFDFVGKPRDPPVLKALTHGDATTAFHVSWNGATEIASWDFYVSDNDTGAAWKLGSAVKSGFETAFVAQGIWAYAYAEARDGTGQSLGRSNLTAVVLLNHSKQGYDATALAMPTGMVQSASTPHRDMWSLESRSVFMIFTILNAVFAPLSLFTVARWLLARRKQRKSIHVNHVAPRYAVVDREKGEGEQVRLKLLQDTYEDPDK